MNDGSSLFAKLTREQLEGCSLRYLGEPLVDAHPLSGGLFNTTYRLETATRSAILRLGPVNRHLLQPYERKLMEAEALVLGELRKRNFPSSHVIALDLSREYLDRDVMVVDALPGFSASTMEWNKEQDAKLCRETGALLRRFHEITAADILPDEKKPFGRLGNVLAGFGGASWAEAIAIEVGQWCALARTHALAEEAFITRVENVFSRHEALFQEIREAKLVHGDLWLGNLLVDTQRELIAVIDGDRAVLGDGQWEFATGWMTMPELCRGYGLAPDTRPESVLRRRFYKLLMNLEDVFVLRCQYNKPEMARQVLEDAAKELAALEEI